MKPNDFNTNIFTLFDQKWALVTAGTPTNFNSMTISSGSMGTIWGMPRRGIPIVTIYISPLRYTYELLNLNEKFTVSFYSEEHMQDLILMGSRSGRNTDKLQEVHLTPMEDNGFMTYEEAEYTFECEKLYQQTLDRNLIPLEIVDTLYAPGADAHRMYIGEVVRILEGKGR